MHAIYELKEMLCDELEEYGKKGELTAGSLETVDKLAHAIKNLNKIIEAKEDYSGNYYYDDIDMRDRSYAQGRGRTENARRNSMGRYSRTRGYSRDEGMIAELHELMKDAPDERTKKEFEKFISKIEMM